VLVVLSIALITIYFRESSGGGLHQVQSAGSTVLRPFEIAAERVARPFRDAYGYFADLVNAKSENGRLKKEVDSLRQQATQNATAASENAQLKRLLDFKESASFPADYDSVATRVIAQPSSAFAQSVTIDAGKTSGIRQNDAVVNDDGLVGLVTKAMHDTAQVTLLTDETSAASAVDIKTNAGGIVKPGQAGLELINVPKDERVDRRDILVTAGWKSGTLSSIYPRGIPIGTVTYVGQTEVDLYKRVQVEPFVDFKSISAVLVLIPKKR
jgi:rod shape-determining protein MreC